MAMRLRSAMIFVASLGLGALFGLLRRARLPPRRMTIKLGADRRG
jgi:hypothetical protein